MDGVLSSIVLVLCCSLFVRSGASRPFYTAAVFEHARFENGSARLVIETNLQYYRKAAEEAKLKGADVIIFPEYGIFPYGNRSEMKEFVEYTPDPKKERVNPCENGDLYRRRPILYALSCMAKDNSLVVVANSGDIQDCTGQDQCPADGVFHFNTNVVFDRDGTLLVRYYKEHLYLEFSVNLPPNKPQDSTFKTDFGIFATYICFDILYSSMGAAGRQPGVDAVFFSTMWFDAFPQYVSVPFFQSWALGNNVTLLAANIQKPHQGSVGSGIFHRRDGALAYAYNPDGLSKLVVANVPKSGLPPVSPNASITAITPDKTFRLKNIGSDVPKDCSSKLVRNSGYLCFEEWLEGYTFTKLSEPSGRVEACNNGMCCSLDYSTRGLGDENFYLGVSNGTFNSMDRYFWCEENCFLARCDAYAEVPCAVFPTETDTVFQSVYLRANFTADVVNSQVVASGMRLVPADEWHVHSVDYHHPGGTFSRSSIRSLHFDSTPGKRLVSAGMKGRCYQRDPPYVK